MMTNEGPPTHACHWTAQRERRAIVRHLARCSVCAAWLACSRHQGDQLLLDAADQLALGHAENDAERAAFARSAAQRTRQRNGMGETRAEVGSELPISGVTSKTEVSRVRRDA